MTCERFGHEMRNMIQCRAIARLGRTVIGDQRPLFGSDMNTDIFSPEINNQFYLSLSFSHSLTHSLYLSIFLATNVSIFFLSAYLSIYHRDRAEASASAISEKVHSPTPSSLAPAEIGDSLSTIPLLEVTKKDLHYTSEFHYLFKPQQTHQAHHPLPVLFHTLPPPTMANSRASSLTSVIVVFFLCTCSARAQLSADFYLTTCPNLQSTVQNAMRAAIGDDPRLPASIIRLFFHDCFVNVREMPLKRVLCCWFLLL